MHDTIRERRLAEYKQALNRVRAHFGDATKAITWMRTVNPMLGNQRPVDMIVMGRYAKLSKFIDTSLSENAAPAQMALELGGGKDVPRG